MEKLRKVHYSLLNLLQPTKIILQTQYFFLDYIHNLKRKRNKHTMKNYQLNIIKEYISTALISEEPEVYLQAVIRNLFDYLCDEDTEHELEALFEAEKKIPIRRTA